MKYNKNINADTFNNAGNENIAVSINFFSPYSYFTNLNNLVTLKTLKTLANYGPDLRKETELLPLKFKIISKIDVRTTKKSN